MKKLLFAAVPILALAAYVLVPTRHVETSPTPDSARHVAIEVGGMTCAGCAVSVKHALNGLDGVYGAEIDVEGSKATVAFAPEKVTIDQIVNAINSTGFSAKAPDAS